MIPFLYDPTAAESHVVKSNHRPAVEVADSDAPTLAWKGSGHVRRRLSKPPLAELHPKELRLPRMAELNVKSDAGIQRERLESYRLNSLRI